MVARIIKGKDIAGLIRYNEKTKSTILYSQYINDAKDTTALTQQDKIEAFQAYIRLNPGISKPTFHVSLNPDPRDVLDDDQLQAIGRAYMTGMDYGDQPYLIYKHEDIARIHLHIVSVNIRLNGKAINSSKERYRSETIRKQLEVKYQLFRGANKEITGTSVLAPVSLSAIAYGQTATKKAIAHVVSVLARDYYFSSLSAFRSMLHHYQVTVDEIQEGSRKQKTIGLLYAIINEAGEKVSTRIKASKIDQAVCYPALLEKFALDRQQMVGGGLAADLRTKVGQVLSASPELSQQDFKSCLAEAGWEVVCPERINKQGEDQAFLHAQTKTVWDGPSLALALAVPFPPVSRG